MTIADTAYPHVLAFGDSLTAGYGLPASQSFPAQLQALLRRSFPAAQVRNAGVSGDTTRSGLVRLPKLLSGLRTKPDLAIVELGANDMLRFVDPATIRQNLDAILTEFARCDIAVLLAGMVAPPILGAVAARFNALYPDLAARHAVPLYPFFLNGAIGAPDLTIADRIHPSAKAVGIVARNILPSVVAALGNPGRAASVA